MARDDLRQTRKTQQLIDNFVENFFDLKSAGS